MPSLPLIPCTSPGCRALSTGGLCAPHRRRQKAEYARSPAGRACYDAAYERLRPLCFVRDGWRCVDCAWEPDIVRDCRELGLGPPPVAMVLDELRGRFRCGQRHLHADHQIAIAVRPDLRLALDNLRTRCNA